MGLERRGSTFVQTRRPMHGLGAGELLVTPSIATAPKEGMTLATSRDRRAALWTRRWWRVAAPGDHDYVERGPNCGGATAAAAVRVRLPRPSSGCADHVSAYEARVTLFAATRRVDETPQSATDRHTNMNATPAIPRRSRSRDASGAGGHDFVPLRFGESELLAHVVASTRSVSGSAAGARRLRGPSRASSRGFGCWSVKMRRDACLCRTSPGEDRPGVELREEGLLRLSAVVAPAEFTSSVAAASSRRYGLKSSKSTISIRAGGVASLPSSRGQVREGTQGHGPVDGTDRADVRQSRLCQAQAWAGRAPAAKLYRSAMYRTATAPACQPHVQRRWRVG